MKTDWNLIRAMMNTAIDSCEQIEQSGYAEADRGRTCDVNGQAVSLHDFMVSAWTYPENIRYKIVRERHQKGIDLPYVPEAARIVNAMAAACAELIGAAAEDPAGEDVRRMIDWYSVHAIPHIRRTLGS